MSVLKTSTVLLPYRLAIQAGQTPEALAVHDVAQQLTFAELNGRANQLARLLQTQGVGPESIVAVCLERSVELVVALLGVLKAGAAYLPIDPSYPTERIQWLLADAGTAVCLTHSSLAVHLPAGSQSTALFLDQSDYILSLLSSKMCRRRCSQTTWLTSFTPPAPPASPKGR